MIVNIETILTLLVCSERRRRWKCLPLHKSYLSYNSYLFVCAILCVGSYSVIAVTLDGFWVTYIASAQRSAVVSKGLIFRKHTWVSPKCIPNCRCQNLSGLASMMSIANWLIPLKRLAFALSHSKSLTPSIANCNANTFTRTEGAEFTGHLHSCRPWKGHLNNISDLRNI